MEAEMFGTEDEFQEGSEFCIEDYTFGSSQYWDNTFEVSDSGKSFTRDGVACTTDAELYRRYISTNVVPTGLIADDPDNWPRNVQIANDALPGAALEQILAAIPYDDAGDREDFQMVWQWFPAICSEKPADSTMTYMDNCRWEFVAVTLIALTAEMEEYEFNAKKETVVDAADV